MSDTQPVSAQRILLFSIFIVSLCGITYELVLGSLATYLLGNPVVQYSITIGFFLSSMGIGSYLTRFITRNLLRTFIILEAVLGLIGGLSVMILNYLFSFSAEYYLLHIFFLLVIGALVGLEIPLLTRILKKYGSFKTVISNVLTIDYIGGLAGSLLFPLVLFPFFGRFLTCVIIGMFNVIVSIALVGIIEYPEKKRADYIFPAAVLVLLSFLAIYSQNVESILKNRLYGDDVVFSKRSKYQEIVLTRSGDDFRLYLDGSIQFSTSDEYRYHEMLVSPVVMMCGGAASVLVMGGGDGMAVREVLKHQNVNRVVLVELDPMMISLATKNASFRRINRNSLLDKRVEVRTEDAYTYLIKNHEKFNAIIADFSDPHDETISKLYTREFYGLVSRALAADGLFVTQATSPLSAREAFWCINNTIKTVFSVVVPYHVYVPSFGDWGFVLASRVCPEMSRVCDDSTARYFSREMFAQAVQFPRDSAEINTKINTFDKPVVYSYYLKGWKYTD